MGFLLLGLAMPSEAQPQKNLPKLLKKSAHASPGFQAALRHAQAARIAANQKIMQSGTLEQLPSVNPLPEIDPTVHPLSPALSQQITQTVMREATLPKRAPKKSPEQWLKELELFIEQKGRFPALANADEKKLLVGVSAAAYRLGPKDPIAKRIRELRNLYPRKPYRVPAQARLAQLETFIQQNGYFPRRHGPKEELKLYENIIHLKKSLLPNDPISERIRELRQQYPPQVSGNLPNLLLAKLETFVQKNGYFPRYNSTGEEKTLYGAAVDMLSRLPAHNPVAMRIRELRFRKLP